MNTKYIVFVYDQNNPIGGIDDVWGAYDNLNEARKDANWAINSKDYGNYYQICKIDTSLVLVESSLFCEKDKQ